MTDREEYRTGGLARLDELDGLDVAEGDVDPRGWDVIAADGRKVGKVRQLIADAAAMRVRYLEVELVGAVRRSDDQPHVLVPIGNAQLDDDGDRVGLPSLSSADIAALPTYREGTPITREYETSLTQRLRGDVGTTDASTARTTTVSDTPSAANAAASASAMSAMAGGATDVNADLDAARRNDFYASEHFDENRFRRSRLRADADTDAERERRLVLSEEQLDIGTRREQRGMIEVRKRVETERVTEQVPLRREEVTVERRPLSADASTEPVIGDTEIRIPLMAEEVVIEKRVVPTEELVIKKHAVQTEHTVEADVRRERVEVDDERERVDPRRAGRPASDATERPNP